MALDGLPVPISTPGWDNAPYLSAGHYITKDPDTGIQNVGNYRGQLKAPRRLGMNPSVELRAGIYRALAEVQGARRADALRRRGRLPAGDLLRLRAEDRRATSTSWRWPAASPAVRSMSCARKTVDLLVPAEAEIVIEGFINTEWLEPEAPFGESHGYVNLQEYNAFMDVTAITRRRHPDSHLLHQPGDAERIERHPPRGDGAGLPRHHLRIRAVDPWRQARRHARAADQPLCRHRRPVRARHARDRNLARAAWCIALHRFAGKWIDRRRRGYRSGKCRRAVLGDVVSLPTATRSQSGRRTRIPATGRAGRATTARARRS